MLQIDKIAPMAPVKTVVQLCFQIFNPFIIINNLAGSQVQIYFPVYDLTEDNLILCNDAPLISLLHQQAVFAGVLHGSIKALHRLFKLVFIHRLDQIVVGLYLKRLEHHLSEYRNEYQKAPELIRPQFPCRFHTVHVLHLDIQKQNVDLPIVA